MAINEKLEFAKRMNQVADWLGVPPNGNNRQSTLGKIFGVSQESATVDMRQSASCACDVNDIKISPTNYSPTTRLVRVFYCLKYT